MPPTRPPSTPGMARRPEMTIGLKGHVLNPGFPESYNNWQETNPRELIDAELITEPTDKNVVRR